VVKSRVLKRIFGIKMIKVTAVWRQLDNEEPHNLYCSTNIISIIKTMGLRWAEKVAHMEEETNAYKYW
jgi:hypothetical protein